MNYKIKLSFAVFPTYLLKNGSLLCDFKMLI